MVTETKSVVTEMKNIVWDKQDCSCCCVTGGSTDTAEEKNSELEDQSEEITRKAAQKGTEMQNVKRADNRRGEQVRKSQPRQRPRGKDLKGWG